MKYLLICCLFLYGCRATTPTIKQIHSIQSMITYQDRKIIEEEHRINFPDEEGYIIYQPSRYLSYEPDKIFRILTYNYSFTFNQLKGIYKSIGEILDFAREDISHGGVMKKLAAWFEKKENMMK